MVQRRNGHAGLIRELIGGSTNTGKAWQRGRTARWVCRPADPTLVRRRHTSLWPSPWRRRPSTGGLASRGSCRQVGRWAGGQAAGGRVYGIRETAAIPYRQHRDGTGPALKLLVMFAVAQTPGALASLAEIWAGSDASIGSGQAMAAPGSSGLTDTPAMPGRHSWSKQ
jgi:hypothetical protein